MIEEQTIRLLDTLRPAIVSMSPVVYVAVLLGMINSCVFYILMGRGFRLFVPYLVLGAAAAVAGATVGRQLPVFGPLIGEVSVLAACAASWSILLIARSMRL